jgi:hypothetical protein
MKVTELKNIMKEINEPNEFIFQPFDKNHPFYWIFRVENVRIKTISPKITNLRKHSARFDIFINGLFIATRDYIVEQIDNDLYVKLIKNNFPAFDRFGNPYDIEDTDEVKIKGDVENIN